MRVMISQPMNGLPELEIRYERQQTAAQLTKQGHEIVDTVFEQTEAPEGVNAPLWLLGKVLQAMAQVDAVYFMDGWEKDRQCRLECQAADAYGLTTLNAKCQDRCAKLHLFPATSVLQTTLDLIECHAWGENTHAIGRFLLNKAARKVILLSTQIVEDSSKSGYLWAIKTELNDCLTYIHPMAQCVGAFDMKRFINNGSKLMCKLRNELIKGNIYIVGEQDFDSVTYTIEEDGRYNVMWHNYAPITSLYAIACSLFE